MPEREQEMKDGSGQDANITRGLTWPDVRGSFLTALLRVFSVNGRNALMRQVG